MIYGVVGNRKGWTKDYIFSQLKRLNIRKDDQDMIVSGGAEGVDSYAVEFAKKEGITYLVYPPNPTKPVPERYYERNARVAEKCDILIAFNKRNHALTGTRNTINYATEIGKDVRIYE